MKVETGKKEKIKEVFMLRAVACMAVVLLHSISFTQEAFRYGAEALFNGLEILLMFGTPTFIFISEMLIARAYKDKVPSNFFSKRFKAIIIPFAVMAIFYAVFHSINSPSEIPQKIISYLLGGYHGYFVIIIFQFYILHVIFNNYMREAKPLKVILIALIINVIYLGIFTFTEAPSDNDLIVSIWERGYWMPFVGWIFYFALAYYSGVYYKNFVQILKDNKFIIIISPFILGSLVLWIESMDWFITSSKRIDVLLFATSMIFFIYLFALNMKSIPKFIVKVSQYSFGIYLLHMFYIAVFNKMLGLIGINWGILNLLVVFVLTLTFSMVTINILNRLPYGEFIAGRVGVGYQTSKIRVSKNQQSQTS